MAWHGLDWYGIPRIRLTVSPVEEEEEDPNPGLFGKGAKTSVSSAKKSLFFFPAKTCKKFRNKKNMQQWVKKNNNPNVSLVSFISNGQPTSTVRKLYCQSRKNSSPVTGSHGLRRVVLVFPAITR